jgi:hypothetical protein
MSMATRTDTQSPALQVADRHELIRVQGARENNLKDVSVELPKRRLTMFTGVSALHLSRGDALADPTDHARALARYQTEHRTLVDPKQRNVGRTVALLIPKTPFGTAARNLTARLWLSRR